MNKKQLIRMRSFFADSIKAWGPGNPLSAEASIWVADLDKEIGDMANEYLETEHSFLGFVKRDVQVDEVLMLFDDDGADAFKEWWHWIGAEAFARWCRERDKYRHLAFVRDDE